MSLIVGVGNPGIEYHYTRHNIAWRILDSWEELEKSLVWKEKFKGLYASESIKGEKHYFLKPQTFMNLSGESVLPAQKFFKIDKSETLVIHDELDLEYGMLAFKKGGGFAGHNGLKSISSCCGGPDFLRLRVGVGRPPHGNVSSWVLSKHTSDEEIVLEDFLKLSAKAIQDFLTRGFEKAANAYSRKKI